MNQMVRKELASAVRVQPPRRRASHDFSCQIQRYRLDDRIANQELRYDLDLGGIRSPMFLDRPGGCGCFPNPLNAGRGEIDHAGITPPLDYVGADLTSDHVAPGKINPKREIAERDPRMKRRFVDNV